MYDAISLRNRGVIMFKDKIVVITGSVKGIGKGIKDLFKRRCYSTWYGFIRRRIFSGDIVNKKF